MPTGGSPLIGGFGRIYFGNRVFRKDDSTVTIGPALDSVLGVDEDLGIVYAGRTYRGVFLLIPTTTLLRVSRDPDLRDVLSVFNSANHLPVKAVPEADLATFTPGPHGQYAFLSADTILRKAALVYPSARRRR